LEFADRLALGFQVTLIGIGVVFVTLYLMGVVIRLLRFLPGASARGAGAGEAEEARVPERAAGKAPAESGRLEARKVAAIVAAVAGYMDSEMPSRRGGAPAPARGPSRRWALEGRKRQMQARGRVYGRRGRTRW